MGIYQFLYFYTTSSLSPLKLLARRPVFLATIRRYSKENYEHHAEEKAPTTAEEFIRVAEEMAEEKEEQVFSSQTIDKAQHAMKEATTTDSNFESVKESFKEGKKENFHKKGDDTDDLLKSNPQSQISS
ncbi:uncharacterized protein LOC129893203 [Solanum dulcamara]|uniref:uncharacterized protein LOC129893203 n=1 Tax=Solanum dulcamara TaxID=45834 RepID=UPI002485D3B9|nr:uncharacterized protein LOC129893203 [Solanum dulcamara]